MVGLKLSTVIEITDTVVLEIATVMEAINTVQKMSILD